MNSNAKYLKDILVQPFVALGEALRFLTVLPIPGTAAMSERSVTAAIPWFPIAGAVIGLLLLPLGWCAGWAWNENVRAALIVVTWGIITSGFHLDGLSDTFDAIMSWRSRERKLEIMKDSRIGAMGAIALGAILLLKCAFLSAAGDTWWRATLLAPIVGRWADIYGIFFFPAAREGGLGQTFCTQVQRRDFLYTTITTLTLAVIIGGQLGVVAILLVWLSIHLLAHWWTKVLGGLTGDTYGALCEISETITLATLTIHMPLLMFTIN